MQISKSVSPAKGAVCNDIVLLENVAQTGVDILKKQGYQVHFVGSGVVTVDRVS